VAGRRELSGSWSIVRRLPPNGKALGEELKGSFKDSDPRGLVRHGIDLPARATTSSSHPGSRMQRAYHSASWWNRSRGSSSVCATVPPTNRRRGSGTTGCCLGRPVRSGTRLGREAVFDGLDARLQPVRD
jgi:hypothetical protein